MVSDSDEAVAIPETTTPALKTVYLIRHAESDENRRLGSLKRIFTSCPNKSDLVASMELLNVQAQIDSDVSEVGRRQINQLGARLKKENFVEEKGIQLVAHSPLKRARQTSEGMLRCVTSRPDVTTEEDSTADGAKTNSVSRVVELEILKERTPIEWLPTNYVSFTKRIASFEQWLGEQPEDVIAIVGHSQYFRSMLGLDFKFGNCDVWQLQFDCSVATVQESVRIDEHIEEPLDPKRNSSPPDIQAENDTVQDSSKVVTTIRRDCGWSRLTKLHCYDENI